MGGDPTMPTMTTMSARDRDGYDEEEEDDDEDRPRGLGSSSVSKDKAKPEAPPMFTKAGASKPPPTQSSSTPLFTPASSISSHAAASIFTKAAPLSPAFKPAVATEVAEEISKKKKDTKKVRNIDMFLEELKQKQDPFGVGDPKKAEIEATLTMMDKKMGSHDTGDPNTTNIYVGNLAPTVHLPLCFLVIACALTLFRLTT